MQKFINRDISWLYFNERVLEEARKADVPVLEQLKFLAIYSSNLDEFYRVRIPILHGLRRVKKKQTALSKKKDNVYKEVKMLISRQQDKFGAILTEQVIPALRKEGVFLIYGQGLPKQFEAESKVFFQQVMLPRLQVTELKQQAFFPINNVLYFLAVSASGRLYVVNLVDVPRFLHIRQANRDHVLFVDDILKAFLTTVPRLSEIREIYSFKVTRDADLELDEGLEEDIATALEREVAKRDFGLATRLLYPPELPKQVLSRLLPEIGLIKSSAMQGGTYHNLKDFFEFPIRREELLYPKRENIVISAADCPLFEQMEQDDILLHTPYQSYETVVRFFAESADDPKVTAIYTSIYRIAEDSRIGQSLLKAAQNGKKVSVFVELKARFDESNNIHWAKRLAEAGVQVTYSIPHLKVHAKIGLVERMDGAGASHYGLISTGNLNEQTAKVYADHSILTKDVRVTADLIALFGFLQQRRVKNRLDEIEFKHLLVAHFNLLDVFKARIDEEIAFARSGEKAHIVIKLNNIEDEEMISKLYAASQAGVQVDLIIRSICRVVPGVTGLSDNIRIKRIVGRYLEHSRIFYFYHGGAEYMYAGSADWMVRNLHHRIEVCTPITNKRHKQELKEYLRLQWLDRVSAVILDSDGKNVPLDHRGGEPVQDVIYHWLHRRNTIL